RYSESILGVHSHSVLSELTHKTQCPISVLTIQKFSLPLIFLIKLNTIKHSIRHIMKRNRLNFSTNILLPALLCLATVSWVKAEQSQLNEWLPQATDTIKQQENILKSATPENTKDTDLYQYLKQINSVKSQAQECITSTEVQLSKAIEDLTTLGEPTKKEPAEVVTKRRDLSSQQKKLDTQLASCKLLLMQSQDLIKSINELQQGILAQQLSAHTPDIFSVLNDNLQTPATGLKNSLSFLHVQYRLNQIGYQKLIFLLVLALAGMVSGIYFNRKLHARAHQISKPKDSVSAFTLAVRTSLSHALPVLLPVAITAAFFSITLPLTPLPFITKTSYMLSIYTGLIIIINILLSPVPPAPVYLTKPDALSKRFARQLKILVTLGLIGFFLLTGEFKASLSEPVYYLLRSLYSISLIINMITILWLVRLFSWAILSRGPRIFLSIVLISSLLTELSGYRNLSVFVLGGLLATAISLGFTLLAYRLIKDLCDGLDEGRLEWEKNLRHRLKLQNGARVPGLFWFRIIIFISLWGSFAFLELIIWQLDDPWLAIITNYLTQGFQIGSLNITPALLGGGILSFGITLYLTHYVKKHVIPQTLIYTNLDHGAREAVTSLSGYAGVAIACIIGLSFTGVQMQNIAIIAGALSVGIGFGLQNIVNNFISGLILLFERPIRTGDWIVTGDTEGYVKAINIRSTQIQTFDKADVIVPNSELITAKVKNWMLRDPYGRISVPIGVGYNSDVDKVHQILLDIANKHPMVLKDHPLLSSPKVLFRTFGDSSLNFELRCFISDIDQRLNVISEFNFAIIKAFRRAGIEIPFPQQVVTITNWQDQNINMPEQSKAEQTLNRDSGLDQTAMDQTVNKLRLDSDE
ncbi:MAG: mechanosensitive ion channel, partial [Gammaproteobacteria bacterium]|nr:mechanosensitive ion channel [Gammaproteobacteria bacterium]